MMHIAPNERRDSTDLSPDESFTRPVVDEPRLSIRHLLIGAACVAIYMSIVRLLSDAELPDQDALDTLMEAASGVFAGMALAGLLLLVSRRIRHQNFPRSGGEILWVMNGIGVVCMPTVNFLTGAGHGWPFVFELLADLLVWTPIFAYAIFASRGRWRVYFIVRLLDGAAWYFTCNYSYFTGNTLQFFHGIPVAYIIYSFRLIIETSALTLVAWLDLRRSGQMYPWPHWAGIILELTLAIVVIVYFAFYLHKHFMPLVT